MIFKYFTKKDWMLAVVCVVFVIAQVWLELEIPKYTGEMFKILQSENPQIDAVTEIGIKMIACALISLAFAFITGLLSSRIAASLGKTLREKQFDRVQSFSMNEINKFSTPSLITRSTNDINQIQMIIAMGMVVIVRAPVMAIIAIYHIYGADMKWTMATAITIAIILVFILSVMVYVVPRFKKMQWLTDDLNRVTRENLSGIRVVRAYNAENYQEKKFEKSNDDLTNNYMGAMCAMATMMPALMLAMSLLSLAIYYIGAVLISEDIFSAKEIFSNLAPFSQYAIQIIVSFIMIIVIFMILPRAVVAAKRVEEVLDTETSVKGGSAKCGENGKEGEIVFKDVSFRYPGASEDVLSDISFEVKKGETIAFIGATGCGKTTLVNLIPRFYDVTKGEVLIDGVNVKEYDLETLYGKMGYVPQKAVLFQGTIDDNIRYGKENANRNDEELDRAISIAQASEFVSKLKETTKSGVSQGGSNLSGGQKQRVSIARAVCRDPEIYIFDDSFSALDYRTDSILRETLKKETGNVTTVIVAQRIGTIMDADKIIVLEDGKIVGMGKHRELLDNCKVYREIALSQLTEEELVQ